MAVQQPEQRMGLRERKKARTRAAIQDAALRLYIEQGYDATTVEQIADAVEISPSTFFRYFPTKSETVLYDRLDPVFIEAFVNQPADLTPIQALRAAMHEVLDQLPSEDRELEQTRWRLFTNVPELRAALAERMLPLTAMVCEAVAKRLGRTAEDFEVRVWTGALIGGLTTAAFAALADGADFLDHVDAGLRYFEAGLPL